MRRLLCLLLVLAACKSSTKKEAEKKDRLALVTAYVLEGSTSEGAFYGAQFQGDVDHIAETEHIEIHRRDGYADKDTVLRNYIFRNGQLYQVAKRSGRMEYDTMTIRYDTAGRVLARIHSDDREIYYSNLYAYNHAGRLSKIVRHLFSVSDSSVYRYNAAGDTIYADVSRRSDKEITIRDQGDEIVVRHYMMRDAVTRLHYMETYSNSLQTTRSYYEGAHLFSKEFTKYDKYNNPVSYEYRRAVQNSQDTNGVVVKSRSYKIAYEYDSKGNWTSKVMTSYNASRVLETQRKITYR